MEPQIYSRPGSPLYMSDLLQLSPSVMVPSQPDLPTHIENTFFPDLDFSDWITEENVSQYLGQLSNGPLQLPPAEGVMQHNQLSQGWGFYSSTLDPTSVAQYSLHPELAMLVR